MTVKSATSAAKKPVLDQTSANGNFSVSHAATSEFKVNGLRAFFEYRDLGIMDATNGRYVAHVIRAVPGKSAEPCWHRHEADFQMVYVLRGWIEFDY